MKVVVMADLNPAKEHSISGIYSDHAVLTVGPTAACVCVCLNIPVQQDTYLHLPVLVYVVVYVLIMLQEQKHVYMDHHKGDARKVTTVTL